MRYDRQDVSKGISEGIDRAKRHYSIPPALAHDIEPKIADALSKWPNDLHERFVMLFSELVALADATRHANNEDLLHEDEILAFLGNAAWFFNSFKHR